MRTIAEQWFVECLQDEGNTRLNELIPTGGDAQRALLVTSFLGDVGVSDRLWLIRARSQLFAELDNICWGDLGHHLPINSGRVGALVPLHLCHGEH